MVATSLYLVVFRIVHVMAAIAWGGSMVLLVVFVQPTAQAVGPAGAAFMRELLGRRRLVNAILGMAATTIVGGAFLYWHDWQAVGSLGDWLGTSFGTWLTAGAVVAIAAFLIGLFGTRPAVGRVLALGARIAQAGDEPPADLVRELHGLQLRLRRLARTGLGLVAIASFCMATARVW